MRFFHKPLTGIPQAKNSMTSIKTLYVIRHAKSSWDDFTVTDFDRPLKEKGIRDAQHLFAHLANDLSGIEQIAASPAARAKQTAMLLCQVVGLPASTLSMHKILYDATVANVFSVINAFPNSLETVAIVGHNPSLTYFANHFLKKEIDNLPTAGIVKLVFSIDSWDEVRHGKVLESNTYFPKQLK